MRSILSLLVLALFIAAPVSAQKVTVLDDDSWCDESERYNRNREVHCEVREINLGNQDDIRVDATLNGGVEVEGWRKNEVVVLAKVEAGARTRRAAEDMVDKVSINTRGTIESDYPGKGREKWNNKEWISVSYKIYVPYKTDVDVETFNGGVIMKGVHGDVSFEALNGGVVLVDMAGDVRGHTTNGGLHVELAGRTWEGDRLDVSTTNGGVVLKMDEDYSARLEVGTTNGGLTFDFPVLVRGKLDNNLSTTLGDGGNLIRARTTNGGVKVKRL